MNTSFRKTLGIAAVAVAACAIGAASRAQEEADEVPADWAAEAQSQLWPSRFYVGDDAFTVYPPQLERWERDRLEGRAAVAVQPAGADRPLFGSVSVSARTEVDRASSMVTVQEIEASSGSFPTAPERATSYIDAVRRHLSTLTWQVPRERLEAGLAIDQSVQRNQSQPLGNDPPRIVYVQSPSILVPIDGEPVLREMDGLGLRRVLNTRALIVQDDLTNRYFLYVAGYWLEAPTLDDRWTEAQVRPMTLDAAKERAEAEGAVDLLEDDESPSSRAPRVIVSTGPTELVQTDGPPQYAPIGRTDLLFVTNSPNRLFLDLRTQMHYVLLAGRWYRTPSLARGAWDYVPGADLPADFALIPDDHPTESVRVAVPGTPEAEEATIANGVPEFATVKRSAARLEITYDGPPQFRPIEGTRLEAAVNAPVPVIRVDWRTYYALDNGVWFFSDSPDGPWTAAATVPPVVYTIPRSDPLHYVTYVRVYDATPEEVYIGYTPGYVGSYVTYGGTVVYGSGWYYRPWIGTVWYASPVTWGFGFSFSYSWWNPWPYPAWSWAGWRPVPCYRPAWGPWPYRHAGVKHPPVAHHGAAVRPVKAWPRHEHSRAAAGTRDRDRNAFHADRSGMRDIYRRWDPRSASENRSRSRSDSQAAGPSKRDRDAISPGSRQRDDQARRLERNQRPGDGQRARVDAPRSVRPQDRGGAQDRAAAPNSPGARLDRDQRLEDRQRARVDAPRWVRPQDRVGSPDRGAATNSPRPRFDRDRRIEDHQRPRADAPQQVHPQDRGRAQDRAAAPNPPGSQLDRNRRLDDPQRPRVDAPRWVRPTDRMNPRDSAAPPRSPAPGPDRRQRLGDNRQARPDAPRTVAPRDRARPQDRAAAPASPGSPAPARPRASAPGRAPADGALPRSPGLLDDNGARSRQRQFDRPARPQNQQRMQPDVRRRAHRDEATRPAMQNPRPSAPPRAQQPQRQQIGSRPPASRGERREVRGASPQQEFRRDRPSPSAAATTPSAGIAAPPRRERPARDAGRGSRSGPAIGARQGAPRAR